MTVAASSYASIADVQARYPDSVMKQLAPLTGAPAQGDPPFDTDKVQSALNDASAEVNGYLVARYALPLATDVAQAAAAVLTRITVDIALYRMMSLRPLGDTEQARLRYEDAKRDLERINMGRLVLGPAVGQAPVDTQSGALAQDIYPSLGLPVRRPVFSDDALERYRCQ